MERVHSHRGEVRGRGSTGDGTGDASLAVSRLQLLASVIGRRGDVAVVVAQCSRRLVVDVGGAAEQCLVAYPQPHCPSSWGESATAAVDKERAQLQWTAWPVRVMGGGPWSGSDEVSLTASVSPAPPLTSRGLLRANMSVSASRLGAAEMPHVTMYAHIWTGGAIISTVPSSLFSHRRQPCPFHSL